MRRFGGGLKTSPVVQDEHPLSGCEESSFVRDAPQDRNPLSKFLVNNNWPPSPCFA